MAARKRKIAQPKQAAEVQAEPELGAAGEAESSARSEPETEPETEVGAEAEPEIDAVAATEAEIPSSGGEEPPADLPIEAFLEPEGGPDSESDRVTLPPRSRVKDAEGEDPESQPDFDQELLGEGPSD